MYQDTYTSKSDDSLFHLEAGHDLVAPYNSEQRRRNEWCLYWVKKMILLHNNTTIDCVLHIQVSFIWNLDVLYIPLPWPFSFQYISHRRGGYFEANQNATLQKTSRALPALLFGQGLRAT